MNPTPPKLQRQLAPGETLVWWGRPLASRYALEGSKMIPIGLFIAGAGVFFIFGGVDMYIDIFKHGFRGLSFEIPLQRFVLREFLSGLWMLFVMPLIGLQLAYLGLKIAVMPFLYVLDAYSIVFVVTNRRALIFNARRRESMRVRSFLPKQLELLELLERTNGSGSLLFSSEWYQSSESENLTAYKPPILPFTQNDRIGFIEVRNVALAERALRQLVAQPEGESL